jgi:hypothetical protein
MAKLTGNQLAEKWGNRLKGANEAITLGVDSVTVSPTVSAVAKQDKLKANWNKAVDNGKWAAGCRKITVEVWRESMKTRGIPRIASGVDGAMSDMAVFFDELSAFQAPLSAQIAKMPDVTLEDSINRMTAQIRGMAKFSRKS